MANLEVKRHATPAEVGILIFSVAVGVEFIVNIDTVVKRADQWAWMCTSLGGLLYGLVCVVVVRLAAVCHEETFPQYMRRLWGWFLGSLFIGWFFAAFTLFFTLVSSKFGKAVTFFMFDRTPDDVVIMAMIWLCAYCAVQDFGTILRVNQLIFFAIVPVFAIIMTLGLLNFQPDNLLPLWPRNIGTVLSCSLKTWGCYTGFEVLLILCPFIWPDRAKLTKAAAVSFTGLTFLYTFAVIVAIGTLTAKGAAATPYSILYAIKSIELPGTFIERLENYVLLAWIPLVFTTLSMLLFALSQALTQFFQYRDHRPFVLLLVPIMYLGSTAANILFWKQTAENLACWLGIIFTLGVIPATYILALRQIKRNRQGDRDGKDGIHTQN